ncbi:MAG: ATP-binding cassette domain-containing protein, partial [Verrucomicrobia bacterium]|nr:ATP-binding cassette domain-containing protein [Verrucomicrobiota bacterium]
MIEVSGLTKRFGPKAAVDDLSFSVKKGEVLGFLGPNGAGKSTTMRMVTGFLPVTAGEISICDISMIKNPEEAKRKI